MKHCPHCHEPLPAIRRARLAPAPVDTSVMTDAQLHAHYRQTAPVEDARFVLRVAEARLTSEERAALDTLIADAPKRTACYQRLRALQAAQWTRTHPIRRAESLYAAGFGRWINASGHEVSRAASVAGQDAFRAAYRARTEAAA